jgi:hypothetical protein
MNELKKNNISRKPFFLSEQAFFCGKKGTGNYSTKRMERGRHSFSLIFIRFYPSNQHYPCSII